MTLDRIVLDQLFADLQTDPFVKYFTQFMIRRKEANTWELENIDITNLNHWGSCRYLKIVMTGNELIITATASEAKIARGGPGVVKDRFDLHDPQVFGKVLWRAYEILTAHPGVML